MQCSKGFAVGHSSIFTAVGFTAFKYLARERAGIATGLAASPAHMCQALNALGHGKE